MRRIFRATSFRPDARRDVGDELRFHIDMRTQEFVEQGMAPDVARRAALHAFRDVGAVGAELRAGRESLQRTRRRHDRWHELAMDLRFGLRTLRKHAGFTAATLATLGLGIGAATAVFTVVNGVLLRPLPYPDPSRLVLIWMSSRQYGEELPVSSGFYSDIERVSRSIAATAAFRTWRYSLVPAGGRGQAQQVDGARVTPSFFSVMRVRPALGRAFVSTDADSGASPVVILSDALWRGDLGADPSIVGKQIEMSGQRFTVIGVMPPAFTFPRGAELPADLEFGTRTQVWTPLGFTVQDRKNYALQNLAAVARLEPGASSERLAVAVSAELRRWLAAYAPKLDLHYRLATLRDQAGEHVRRGLVFLLAAVGLLLCIACANVTNLLVARTARRQREFAVRAALGAGRARIARQLITENVLLVTASSLVGLAVAVWATRAMLAMVPGSLPRADDIGIDWRVGVAVATLALVAAVVFGLAAATQTGLGRVATSLRDDGSRSTSNWSSGMGRRMLVVAEVSLSLMLLVGAALLTVSFVRLQQVSPGFDPGHVLTADLSLPVPGAFDPARDGPQWARFFQQLQGRLASNPDIDAAGAVSILPLTGAAETGSTATVGGPPPVPGSANETEYYVVEGDYFRTMRIPVLGGRTFDRSDLASSPAVAIVNREYARKYLGGVRAALTHQIRTYFDFGTGKQPRTIVGVVDNVQNGGLDASVQPQVYVPEQQMTYPGLQVVVRTRGDPAAATAVLRREVKAIDPTLPVSRPRPMQRVFEDSLARQRFSMTLIGIFAAAALLLAMVGLYGVISLSVSHRRREIGVRIALGAQGTDVLRLVLGEGVALAATGVTVGLLGAYAASRLVATLLYDVSPTSATVYAGAAVLTIAVTILATTLPARRAMRVDPTVALRGE